MCQTKLNFYGKYFLLSLVFYFAFSAVVSEDAPLTSQEIINTQVEIIQQSTSALRKVNQELTACLMQSESDLKVLTQSYQDSLDSSRRLEQILMDSQKVSTAALQQIENLSSNSEALTAELTALKSELMLLKSEQEKSAQLLTLSMQQREKLERQIILDRWIMAGIGISGLVIGYLLGGLGK